jgi:hypothetical protein
VKTPASKKKAADVSGTRLWLVQMKAHRALERLALGGASKAAA